MTPGAVESKAGEDQVATLHDPEESSSDGGRSQDDAVAGIDNAEVTDDKSACAEAKPRPSWEPGYVMFKHVRTQVAPLCSRQRLRNFCMRPQDDLGFQGDLTLEVS